MDRYVDRRSMSDRPIIPPGRFRNFFTNWWSNFSKYVSDTASGMKKSLTPFNSPVDYASSFNTTSVIIDKSLNDLYSKMFKEYELYTQSPEITMRNLKLFSLHNFDEIEMLFANYYGSMGREYKSKKATSARWNIPKSYIVFLIEIFCSPDGPTFDTNDNLTEGELNQLYATTCQPDIEERSSGADDWVNPQPAAIINPMPGSAYNESLLFIGYDDNGKGLYKKVKKGKDGYEDFFDDNGELVIITQDQLIKNKPFPGRAGGLYKKKRRSTKKKGKKGTKKGGKKRKTSRK